MKATWTKRSRYSTTAWSRYWRASTPTDRANSRVARKLVPTLVGGKRRIAAAANARDTFAPAWFDGHINCAAGERNGKKNQRPTRLGAADRGSHCGPGASSGSANQRAAHWSGTEARRSEGPDRPGERAAAGLGAMSSTQHLVQMANDIGNF